jgi:hypothetical protein
MTFVTNHNLPQAPTTFHIGAPCSISQITAGRPCDATGCPHRRETGDFDGDGDADILWRGTDARSYLGVEGGRS